MQKKKKLIDDRGLSLVELLLSVLILAVITVPLLHSFVTSARTVGKSRDLGDATLCAGNITESVDALLVKELALRMGTAGTLMGVPISAPASDSEFPADVNALENYKNGASYSFELYGIESGRNSYDALVTLDASAYSGSEDAPGINDVPVTQYTPMDAVFSQPGGQYENPDTLTYEDFASQATAMSGEYHSAHEFFSATLRTINIDLVMNNSVLTAVTTYEYSCPFTYSQTITGADGRTAVETYTENLTATFAYEFYREKLETGKSPELTSIYFFYYPNYFGSGTYNDHISIHNENDVSFSLFFIKQKALDYSSPAVNGVYPTMSAGVISQYDAGYTADVSLMESSAVSAPVAQLYSNINQDVSGIGSQIGATRTVRFRAFRGKHWYVDGTIRSKLVATQEENRFFALTVALYDAGVLSGRSAGDEITASPIYTLTSSKLD